MILCKLDRSCLHQTAVSLPELSSRICFLIGSPSTMALDRHMLVTSASACTCEVTSFVTSHLPAREVSSLSFPGCRSRRLSRHSAAPESFAVKRNTCPAERVQLQLCFLPSPLQNYMKQQCKLDTASYYPSCCSTRLSWPLCWPRRLWRKYCLATPVAQN